AIREPSPVFLEKWDALSLISRQKRSNTDNEETKLPANLEREYLEEEAREDIFCTINTKSSLSKHLLFSLVTFPCGKVASLSQWDRCQSANIQSDYEGLTCGSEDCLNNPHLIFQTLFAMLRHGSVGFCSGCVSKYSDFQVAVGKRVTSFEAGEQTLQVKQVHIHPLYADGKAENDMAVVELTQKMVFKKSVLEGSFRFNRSSREPHVKPPEVSGSTDLQGNLMLNHLSHDKLLVCSQRHSGQVTNKMACATPRAKADCILGHGSPRLWVLMHIVFNYLSSLTYVSQGFLFVCTKTLLN
uniref:Peptidase S1 domain-containing protein n=1 Tax=Sinocyclocheilus rhinocerous TaxID=307959 RepID=A0A673IAT6_9TELE